MPCVATQHSRTLFQCKVSCCVLKGLVLILASRSATVDRSEDSTFLRHLELEPTGPDGSVPPLPTHPTATPRPPGRTPFTSTRRLQRASNGGFGFSVAWTQPPRVERVEPGLPAEQAGIRPGDYIIFVDKHNVVTVPEEEVLQLIRWVSICFRRQLS